MSVQVFKPENPEDPIFLDLGDGLSVCVGFTRIDATTSVIECGYCTELDPVGQTFGAITLSDGKGAPDYGVVFNAMNKAMQDFAVKTGCRPGDDTIKWLTDFTTSYVPAKR